MEELQFKWVDVPLGRFSLEAHELLEVKQLLALAEVAEDLASVLWRELDSKATKPAFKIVVGNPLSILEVQITEAVSKYLKSLLDIAVNQLK